jgi:hypothetical protein
MGTHSRASSAAGPRAYPVSLIQLSANSVGAAKETSPYDSPPVTQKSGRRVSPTAGLVRTWAGDGPVGLGHEVVNPSAGRSAQQLPDAVGHAGELLFGHFGEVFAHESDGTGRKRFFANSPRRIDSFRAYHMEPS